MAESLAVVGGVASFAQILIVIVNSIEAFAVIYHDFQDAPCELLQIQTKLRLLQLNLEDFQAFLLDFPDNVVLPLDLRQLIWEALSQVQSNLIAIQGICAVESPQTTKSFRVRLQWASFGKKSMKKMTEHLRESEQTVNGIMQYMTFRHTAFSYQIMRQFSTTWNMSSADGPFLPANTAPNRYSGLRSIALGVDSWIRQLGFYGKFLITSDTNSNAWRTQICIGYCPPAWLYSRSVSLNLEFSRLITGAHSIIIHPIRLQNRVPLDSLFMKACLNGDIRLIRQLLDEKDAAVNDRTICNGKTPLLLAIEGEHLEVMNMLLEEGADPNIGDDGQVLPILAVAGYNPRRNKLHPQRPPFWNFWIEALQLLIKHGASVHETAQDRPISTFHLFGRDYKPDILKFFHLLASKNYVNFDASFGPYSLSAVQTAIQIQGHATKALQFLHRHNVPLNRVYNNGITVLHMATEMARDTEVLEYLCSMNGLDDINRQDKWGRTPLHYGVVSEYYGYCNIPFQKIRYLLSQGADHNVKGGGTPCSIGKKPHPDLDPLEFCASIRPSLVGDFVSALKHYSRSVPTGFEDESFVDALEAQLST